MHRNVWDIGTRRHRRQREKRKEAANFKFQISRDAFSTYQLKVHSTKRLSFWYLRHTQMGDAVTFYIIDVQNWSRNLYCIVVVYTMLVWSVTPRAMSIGVWLRFFLPAWRLAGWDGKDGNRMVKSSVNWSIYYEYFFRAGSRREMGCEIFGINVSFRCTLLEFW